MNDSPFVALNYARFRRYMSHGILEELHRGMRWSEGPVWFADAQALLFSDIPENRIYRWVADQGVSVYRTCSGKSNGLTRDRQGRLIVCESGGRRLTRTELDGSTTVLADRYEGKRLNSPNDVVVHSSGDVWFSDPDYGILSDYTGYRAASEIGANYVYRLDAQTGQLHAAITDLNKPNGLAFCPAERTLYVADSSRSHDPDGAHHIMAYDLREDGVPGPGQHFADIATGVPDGLRVDVDGNLWAATIEDGITIFAPDGEPIGRIAVPDPVANLTFGGAQLNRLFITAGTKLYALYTGSRGISPV